MEVDDPSLCLDDPEISVRNIDRKSAVLKQKLSVLLNYSFNFSAPSLLHGWFWRSFGSVLIMGAVKGTVVIRVTFSS